MAATSPSAPTTPSILSPPRKYCYRYSTSSSSCSISHIALACNFQELADKYPEFRDALMELRCRQQRRLEKASQSEREGRHHRTQTRDNQNGPSSKSTNSSTFSAQITHAFNASLTRALLHHHFQLEIPSLPAGRLCPPIPNRANYVCWLKELLSQSRKDLYRFSDAASITDADDGGVTWQCRGMDIGTGVSAIYPLLLTTNLFFIPPNSGVMDKFERSSKQWEFLATDIDPLAIESARINIRTNRLEDKIHLVQVDDADSTMTAKQIKRGPLFAAMEASKHTALRPRCLEDHSGMNSKELAGYPKFDFVMTNPPFYKTLKEATSPRAGDKRSRTDMSDKESVYTRATCDFGVDMDDDEDCNAGGGGGDVDFVTAIMNDSQFFRHHVTWYTSLVCKKSSLDAIQQKLQTLDGVWGNRGQVRMVEFRQDNLDGSEIVERSHIGSPRVRWGIGWTYERAMIRCSACRVREGLQSFEVWVSVGDADDKARRASDEVASRLITYFENTQNVTWKCSQQMREYINDVLPSGSNDGSGRQSYQDKLMKCVTVVEERFYNPTVPSQEYDNINLPVDGHALIDAFLESSGKYNASGCVSVQVILDMYSHTKHGSAIINMLQCQLPGEIGRTNRKWRRLLQRQTTT